MFFLLLIYFTENRFSTRSRVEVLFKLYYLKIILELRNYFIENLFQTLFSNFNFLIFSVVYKSKGKLFLLYKTIIIVYKNSKIINKFAKVIIYYIIICTVTLYINNKYYLINNYTKTAYVLLTLDILISTIIKNHNTLNLKYMTINLNQF